MDARYTLAGKLESPQNGIDVAHEAILDSSSESPTGCRNLFTQGEKANGLVPSQGSKGSSEGASRASNLLRDISAQHMREVNEARERIEMMTEIDQLRSNLFAALSREERLQASMTKCSEVI